MKGARLRSTPKLGLALVGLLTCFALVPIAHADPMTERLRQRIEDFVQSRSDALVTEVSVPPLEDFAIRDVDFESVEIDLSTNGTRRSGHNMPVTVTLSDGERVLKRGVVTVRVRSERNVVIAARNIRKGDRLRAEDLRIERRDTATLHDQAAASNDHLIGMAATRSISAGTPVRSDWTERPAAVKRGQRVRIVLEGPDLRIEASGVAKSKGAVGEMIVVINQDSRREVVGRVGEDGAIHVAF